jgi:hypothetical protein
MQRLGRIIYNVAMALSLLLCLACAGVWVRSGWVCDNFRLVDWPADLSSFRESTVRCSCGGLQFTSSRYKGYVEGNGDSPFFEHVSQAASEYPRFPTGYLPGRPIESRIQAALGFELVRDAKWRSGMDFQTSIAAGSLTLPLYFPTLLFALLPAHYVLRVRRRRRIAGRLARGCCPACGYDLRASAGRCPECGREAEQAQLPKQQRIEDQSLPQMNTDAHR